MDANTKHFNKYLKKSGILAALTNAFGKLFMLKDDERPENSVWFIQQNLLPEFEEFPSCAEYHKLKQEVVDNARLLVMKMKELKQIETPEERLERKNLKCSAGGFGGFGEKDEAFKNSKTKHKSSSPYVGGKSMSEMTKKERKLFIEENKRTIIEARNADYGYEEGDIPNLFDSNTEQNSRSPDVDRKTPAPPSGDSSKFKKNPPSSTHQNPQPGRIENIKGQQQNPDDPNGTIYQHGGGLPGKSKKNPSSSTHQNPQPGRIENIKGQQQNPDLDTDVDTDVDPDVDTDEAN